MADSFLLLVLLAAATVRGAAPPVQPYVLGPDVGAGRLTREHHPGGRTASHRAYPLVVGVEHGEPAGRQRLDQFTLGDGDPVDRAELADVRHADVDDHTDVRPGDPAQVPDVPRPPRAHLQDQEPGALVGLEHGVRQAQLVVERPRRGHDGGAREGRPE